MSDYSPSVTVLILNWNGQSLLSRCLSSLLALDYPACRLIVVDNGSTDNSVEQLKAEFPDVGLIEHGRNLGFSRGYNRAIRQLPNDDDILVLLNNDVFVSPDWLAHLVAPFADSAVGVAGCKLLYPDARHIQHAGAELIYPLAMSRHFYYGEVDGGQADELRDVPYVTAAALAVRRELVNDTGLFDEMFSPFYFEEVDLCYRIRASGYRVLYVPEAVAIHHESYSTRRREEYLSHSFQRNRLQFVLKYYTVDQFREDFVPAELDRLRTTPASAEDLDTMSRVYLESMLSLSEYGRYGLDRADLPSIWAALDRLWQASMNVEPYRVPGFAFGKPLLEPLVKGLLDLWNAVVARILLWPALRQRHQTNALLSRMIMDGNLIALMVNGDGEALVGEIHELKRQIQMLAESLSAPDRGSDKR
jgi:GT2 family glycosyltransferase